MLSYLRTISKQFEPLRHVGGDVVGSDPDSSARGSLLGGDHPHRGGLARAVVTQQPKGLSLLDAERQIADGYLQLLVVFLKKSVKHNLVIVFLITFLLRSHLRLRAFLFEPALFSFVSLTLLPSSCAFVRLEHFSQSFHGYHSLFHVFIR